jgi:long-chain acyl-CoA synthetase
VERYALHAVDYAIFLSATQYIALERLESIYKSCDLVANICVHAVPDAKQPMALIFPHESNLRHFLSNANLPGVDSTADLATLCHNKAVAEAVLKQCNMVGKKAGFKPLETLEAVVLTPEEWTPENELVTAAQKIQRKKIAQRYDKEIKVRCFLSS